HGTGGNHHGGIEMSKFHKGDVVLILARSPPVFELSPDKSIPPGTIGTVTILTPRVSYVVNVLHQEWNFYENDIELHGTTFPMPATYMELDEIHRAQELMEE